MPFSTMKQHVVVVDPNVEEAIGIGFDNKSVRRNFVKKVYSILAVQLMASILIGSVMLSIPELKIYFAMNAGLASLASYVTVNSYSHLTLSIASRTVALIPLLILLCCPQTGRQFPLNFILLAIFTCLKGFLVGVISCAFRTEVVLMALISTAVCVIVVTVIAIALPFDITNCGCVLCILTLVHMSIFIIGLTAIQLLGFKTHTFVFVLSMLGAFLFSIWLAYDTQMIVGGRKYELSPEDYVFAALALYIDIIHVFLYFLQIINSLRSEQ